MVATFMTMYMRSKLAGNWGEEKKREGKEIMTNQQIRKKKEKEKKI